MARGEVANTPGFGPGIAGSNPAGPSIKDVV